MEQLLHTYSDDEEDFRWIEEEAKILRAAQEDEMVKLTQIEVIGMYTDGKYTIHQVSSPTEIEECIPSTVEIVEIGVFIPDIDSRYLAQMAVVDKLMPDDYWKVYLNLQTTVSKLSEAKCLPGLADMATVCLILREKRIAKPALKMGGITRKSVRFHDKVATRRVLTKKTGVN